MAAPRNDNVKEIILDTTEELMKEQGVDNISLANIATACSISKGTLYYHYKTKEDIVFDIMDRYLKKQEADLLLWLNDESKDTSLNRVLMYVLDRNFHEVGPRFQMLYSACFGNEPLREKVIDRYHRFQTIIADKLQERDDFTKDVANYFSWLALLVTDGMIIQAELGNDAFDADKFIKATEQFFKALF